MDVDTYVSEALHLLGIEEWRATAREIIAEIIDKREDPKKYVKAIVYKSLALHAVEEEGAPRIIIDDPDADLYGFSILRELNDLLFFNPEKVYHQVANLNYLIGRHNNLSTAE